MGSALRWLVAAGLIGALCSGARAQSAAEFYKGRQLQIVVGFEVGNDYDVGARLLARYLSKQIPGNPAIIVQNIDRKSTRLNSSHVSESRMPSSA